MQIPKRVKILGMDYAIEQVDFISREELIIGRIDYFKTENIPAFRHRTAKKRTGHTT